MKAYGVKIIEHPDVLDIQQMGAKSRTGRLPKHGGGDYRGYCRRSNKVQTRRYWKRIARRAGKAECQEG